MSDDPQVRQTRESHGRRQLLLIGGLLLLGVALVLLLFGGSLFGQGAEEAAVLEQIPPLGGRAEEITSLTQGGAPLTVGDTAYNFALQDLEGNTVALNDFRGRPVIINFWATWCAPCRIEMPELERAFQAHEDQGLAILALNQAEQPDTVRTFFHDQLGLTFTPLLDEESAVADAYGAINLPTTFFVNAAGEITAVHRGVLAGEQLEGYLADTLP